ncbi:hypothetical protein [Saccharospirillum salsuginis]|uniref:Uncharacterized protein n=1 Tax=Saccharospirillum salsuginis TaxID=418750 RepID=A0A918N517_9GAMM|nr:hypothetical protein [Saccharospirillum salsuginis]GGX40035.1 hypothetical protein GCM10007392_03280 [Saccharospirillum salsuginis]
MERTLFVFEGEVREKQYFQSLERVFFSGEESHILVSFKNDIYELYKILSNDKDLDPFELIKEMNPTVQLQEELATLRRDQIGQIYLFFDMEPYDDFYSDQNLMEMLELFDNETEHGKLFVSYPMVEAMRDIDDHTQFLYRTASLSDCTGKKYKRLSAERGSRIYQDAKKIDKQLWQGLVTANVKKANGLVNSEFSDTPILDPMLIAQAQLSKFLPNEYVAVLSAFPIFLADYFGRKIYEF